MKNYLAIALATAVIAGCGSKDEPKAAASVPLAAAQDAQAVPVTPPPAAPNAAADGVQRPAPGQANDHSSPGFKSGGKTDLKK